MDKFENPVITSMEELYALPLGDQNLLLCFQRLDPKIASFPHCIFRATRSTLETVLTVVPDKPGWYGGSILSYLHLVPKRLEALKRKYPVFEHYAEYIDSWEGWRDIWAWPEMQEIIRESYGHSLDNFHMLIDIMTDKAILDHIPFDDEPNISYGTGEFLERSIPQLINELKWAYILLEEDTKYTLFVTGNQYSSWVDEVKSKLIEAQQEVITLHKIGSRYYWQEHSQKT